MRPYLTIKFIDSFFWSLDLHHPGDVKIAQGSFRTRDLAIEVGIAQARGSGLQLYEQDRDGTLSPIATA
jgi:hypothetical protein